MKPGPTGLDSDLINYPVDATNSVVGIANNYSRFHRTTSVVNLPTNKRATVALRADRTADLWFFMDIILLD